MPLINDTVQQFISGIVIIVLIAMHILSYMYLPPIKPDVTVNTIHLVIDILLFIAIAVHLNISIPKLLVSLGFLHSKDSYENIKKKTKFAISIILILIILGEIIFYVGGIL